MCVVVCLYIAVCASGTTYVCCMLWSCKPDKPSADMITRIPSLAPCLPLSFSHSLSVPLFPSLSLFTLFLFFLPLTHISSSLHLSLSLSLSLSPLHFQSLFFSFSPSTSL